MSVGVRSLGRHHENSSPDPDPVAVRRGVGAGAGDGYAPVNGLEMYYEIHGKGDPVILLHGSFMTITNNWPDMIGRLSKSRQVLAVEMQGHDRTADINRDLSFENFADDTRWDTAWVVASPCRLRSVTRQKSYGWVKEAVEMFPRMDSAMLKGHARNRAWRSSPIRHTSH